MKLVLNYVGNNGFYSYYFCRIKEIHVIKKHRYYFQQIFSKRSSSDYLLETEAAELQRKNINTPFGYSTTEV